MVAASQLALKIIETDRSEYALWDECISQAVQSTFFHSSKWIELIADTFKRNYKYLFCQRDGQIVGAMVFFEQRRLFWKLITPVPLFPFTAPVLILPSDRKNQKMISDHLAIISAFSTYLNRSYDYWVLDTPPDTGDLRGFLWNKAWVQPRYTYVVDLSGEQNLLIEFNQSTRKKIKQAENSAPVVQETKETSVLIDLIDKSYARHGMKPLIEKKYLHHFLTLALNLTNVKMYFLKAHQKIIAARLVLYDKDTVYDLLAGSDDQAGAGSTYLVYHIMKQSIPNYRYFDFMGADHSEIEQFKRGFGGSLRQGFRIMSQPGLILSLLIKVHEYRLIQKRKL
jgi:lipid II:glycine glycyltransferase (peptidoglycan interpeptide bridge formation enzyme)